VYQLHLRVSVTISVRIGRPGRFTFPPGSYVYTGRASRALGPASGVTSTEPPASTGTSTICWRDRRCALSASSWHPMTRPRNALSTNAWARWAGQPSRALGRRTVRPVVKHIYGALSVVAPGAAQAHVVIGAAFGVSPQPARAPTFAGGSEA
jgi:hypothetical protein